jgi:penicillin-binding protein 1A
VARIVVRIARQALLVAAFLVAALLGTLSGVLFVYAGDLPQISALDNYAPSTITRVLAANGEVIGEFATERRVVVGYDDVAPVLRQAILAAEDQTFDQHFGLSIPRIVVALVKDLLERRLAAGASTLTQQLARNLFLTYEKTWERKIKEVILAVQIEKRYTKREIFTMYVNQIYFGHGAYGVEAAARLYFGKSARDVTLEEAALIAGIIQGNVRQSPYVNPEAALRRRNYALTRMAEAGYITAAQAEAAKAKPIVTVGLPSGDDSLAPFYVEEVRKHLEATYGARRLYESGLVVHTPLDVRLQAAANTALREGLRRLDKRRGFRRPARNVLDEGRDPATFTHPSWGRRLEAGQIVPAVVTAVEPARMTVRVGGASGTIDRQGFGWTGRSDARRLVRAGDLVEVRIEALDDARTSFSGRLEQEPLVEGAVLAIENRSGRILAMVGGYSFARSRFNRAVQAFRQLGSTFKVVVYTAAIDRGYTPATILVDLPVSYPAGPGQPPYAPTNYDHQWEGPITLRRALEQSRNVPAVRVMDQLGPKQVIAYAKRFGFTSPMEPYLSLALGAAEATLLEATSAFSVFPNQGVRMRPYQILKVVDRDGNVLEENRPEPSDAIRADTAYVMTSLLQGVVERGTAARAASLGWPLGGKTGTTDDFSDAWFIGFDPDITVGVWVGHDQKKPLGPGESGAVAALPIWMDVMKAWIGDRKDPPAFSPPGNVVFVTVDRTTGEAVDRGAPGAISEVFIAGTQPGGFNRP